MSIQNGKNYYRGKQHEFKTFKLHAKTNPRNTDSLSRKHRTRNRNSILQQTRQIQDKGIRFNKSKPTFTRQEKPS